MKNWADRVCTPSKPNENAQAEFELEFPEQLSPWGQSAELDKLIRTAQLEPSGENNKFLGCRVKRCTLNTRIEMLIGEDVSMETVELVANTLNPRMSSGSVRAHSRKGRIHYHKTNVSHRGEIEIQPWAFNEHSTIKHVEGGWLVVLYTDE